MGIEIAFVSCGGLHTAAITTQKELYTWGKGESHYIDTVSNNFIGDSGALGFETSVKEVSTPTKILTNNPVTHVSCGGSHTIFVTENFEVGFYIINFSLVKGF